MAIFWNIAIGELVVLRDGLSGEGCLPSVQFPATTEYFFTVATVETTCYHIDNTLSWTEDNVG